MKVLLRFFKSFCIGLDFFNCMFAVLNLIKTTKMKKIFNLAVAMSVIASSLVFSSCGDDEDDDETPKQEQNTNNNTNNDQNNNQNENKPTAKAETSITPKAGDSYSISNTKLGITGASMSIEKVDASSVTVKVSGSTITIGTGSNPSYAIYVDEDGSVKAATMGEAQKNAANVLFICNSEMKLTTATLAIDKTIQEGASETTFTKQ